LVVAREIVVSAYALYRTALPTFVWRVLPLLALAIFVSPDLEKTGTTGSFLGLLLSYAIDSVAGGVALAAMLRIQVPDVEVKMEARSFVAFIATEIYLSLIIGLAALLLLFPAFWVAAATILAPIYAFAYRQSPVAAVSSSAQLVKGNLRPLMLVAFLWFLFLVTGIGAAYIVPESFEFLWSLVYALLWLYNYALVVVAFARLRPAAK
jgi:hypothetical protein